MKKYVSDKNDIIKKKKITESKIVYIVDVEENNAN